MSKIKRLLAALLIALTTFFYVNTYKPSDHEQLSESPTKSEAETVQSAIPAEDRAEIRLKVVTPKPKVETVPKAEPNPVEVERPKPTTHVFTATFYTARCEGCTGITASGYNVKQTQFYRGFRVLAADRSIPLGTKMRVKLADGKQFDGIVLDRGGAIRGKRLDVLVASKSEAYELGRQQARVTILN